MRILDRGIVFDARTAPRNRAFCSFTNCLVLSDGCIMVSFRAGSSKDSPDENVLIRVSRDEGRSWNTVFEGLAMAVDGIPGAWRMGSITELEPGRLIGAFNWFDRSDPSLPLANPETQGTLPSQIHLLESQDGGRSWSGRRKVDVGPRSGVAGTGPIMILSTGGLALPYETWKAYHDASPGQHHAILRISRDGGHTFGPDVIVAHDPREEKLYWDQRVAVSPETGELVALFWTHDRRARQDVDIHIACGMPNGESWTGPLDTGIAGQIACPLALPGGRLLMVYVHRHHPPSLRAVLSHDFGKSWEMSAELSLYESRAGRESGMDQKRDFGDYWADMNVWAFGHPVATVLPNGDLFVAFYSGDSAAMGIHWVRLAL